MAPFNSERKIRNAGRSEEALVTDNVFGNWHAQRDQSQAAQHNGGYIVALESNTGRHCVRGGVVATMSGTSPASFSLAHRHGKRRLVLRRHRRPFQVYD